MSEEIKNCDNCCFFKRYYIKYETCYRESGLGRCVCPEVKNTLVRKKFKERADCKFWRPLKPEKQKNIQNIKDVLRHMESHLADIMEFLKNEKD